MLMHDYMQLKNNAMSQGSVGNVLQSTSTASGSRSLRFSIAGAATLVSAAFLGAAHIVDANAGLPWWVWSIAVLGAILLIVGLRQKY